MSTNVNYTELKALEGEVIAVAKKAAAFIAQESLRFSTKKVESKGKNDFVSYVDRGAEKIVLEGLSSLPLQAGIISEEGSGVPQPGNLNWIVDPLDGTTNFIHGMPPYCVSIGLVDGEKPLLGVIAEVFSGEIYHAVKGGGAFLNGVPIHSSECKKIADSLIATGFPYREYNRMGAFMETLDYFMRNSHGMRRLGSAAIDLAYVACGRVDAFYEYGLHAWDVAAGLIIVEEAGGKYCDFQGGQNVLFGGELIAATAPLFPEMAAYLTKTMSRIDG